jgi:NAD(P)-dependent dehydrogenase (short-subunit alcohol dehydrogenase family)
MSKPRRWFITGVSRGIGQALAEAALDRGDAVVGCVRTVADLTKFTALAPDRARGIQVDVTRPDDIKRAVALAIEDGPLDIVVSNAGQSIYGAFEEISLAEARSVFDVNLFGPWAVAQAVLPYFRQRGCGQLVHISSGCGLIGVPGLSAYSASKFALEGLSEALAHEVAQFGIKLLLVEPGAIDTGFVTHSTREPARRMPEYSWLSGEGKTGLAQYSAANGASPTVVADAILAALANPHQQLRLLVGDDIRSGAREKAEEYLKLVSISARVESALTSDVV